ncbi:hypothetical protein SCA03_41190 [Streptomyces cacaoi]|uniref:Uncharacterized protein n=1 Tax=Streptomyces cacaoi TaxID=1898 RepID=A0A4Y3R4A0_STRCI|nr:hypothetical protein SCA03_41190 [Streptomyces cacaoi]
MIQMCSTVASTNSLCRVRRYSPHHQSFAARQPSGDVLLTPFSSRTVSSPVSDARPYPSPVTAVPPVKGFVERIAPRRTLRVQWRAAAGGRDTVRRCAARVSDRPVRMPGTAKA